MRKVGPIFSVMSDVSGCNGRVFGVAPRPKLRSIQFTDSIDPIVPTDMTWAEFQASVIDGSIVRRYGEWSTINWGTWVRELDGWYYLARDERDHLLMDLAVEYQHVRQVLNEDEIRYMEMCSEFENACDGVPTDDVVYFTRYGHDRYGRSDFAPNPRAVELWSCVDKSATW